MDLTLAEIRSLHAILTTQRAEHEKMRTEMLALREHSRRMRNRNASLYATLQGEACDNDNKIKITHT